MQLTQLGGESRLVRRNELLVPQAESALDQLKMETAQELGLLEKIQQVGWGDMTTCEVGAIGGHMVRKMINAAEDSLAAGATATPSINHLNSNPF